MKILIVDDELDLVETLKRGLRRKGYEVLETTSSQEALNLLHDGTDIELVITDYVMPFMNGIELLENIRINHPLLPVIIMTAYGQRELLVNALHNSCSGYIEKPFTLEQLTEEIARAKANASRQRGCSAIVEELPMLVHQINNPLMAINGTAEMAMTSLDDPEAVRNYMNRIMAATRELSKLNKEIMCAAKQSNKETQAFDINSLAKDCLNMFQDLLATQCIRLKTCFTNRQLPITGYRFDVEQMLKNLILNAIDAMRGKLHKQLKVTTGFDAESSSVMFSIEDSGCGIDEDCRDKLFESYFTLKRQGTGLGLAVVKRVVERHQGRIEIESEVGQGSTFRVLLPVQAG